MDSYNFDSSEQLPDEEIVKLINEGHFELLGIIISRYQKIIGFYANKYCVSGSEIDELIQDGTFALYKAVGSFDNSKASFSTFATLCVKRAIHSSVRSFINKKNIPDKLISSLEDIEIADSNSPEKIFFDKENFKSLADTIKLELSSLEYNVLLSFLSGKSYTEISSELNLSIKSVDNALMRIRAKLRSK